MVWLLKGLGWLGIIAASLNASIKLFADDNMALRYAGPGRDLDLNISVISFCLLFLALAYILQEIRDINAQVSKKGEEN